VWTQVYGPRQAKLPAGVKPQEIVCGLQYCLVRATQPTDKSALDGSGAPRGVLFGAGENGCGQLGLGHAENALTFQVISSAKHSFACLLSSSLCLLFVLSIVVVSLSSVRLAIPGRLVCRTFTPGMCFCLLFVLPDRAQTAAVVQRAALGGHDVQGVVCAKGLTGPRSRPSSSN